MKYTAKGQRRQYFELYNDVDQVIGTVSYDEWLGMKATVTVPGDGTYELAPSGFWMMNIEMQKEGIVVASAKRNWATNVIITIGETGFHFQSEGLFARQTVLTTEEGEDVAIIKPDFQWSILNFTYEIETSDSYSELNNPAVLLFLIHCCNSIMKSRAVF